jgi:Aspartyl protease
MARGQGHFSRRKLLGARVKLDNHDLVALVDSGCEVELVLSRRLADQLRIDYSHISREVSLPDGTRMTATRTSQLTLDTAGSHKNLTAVVVDMVACECILSIPLLDAASPVVNWKARKPLLPTKNGPKEVDLSHNPCPTSPTLVSYRQPNYLGLAKKEARCSWQLSYPHPKHLLRLTKRNSARPGRIWSESSKTSSHRITQAFHPGKPSSSRSSSNPVQPRLQSGVPALASRYGRA